MPGDCVHRGSGNWIDCQRHLQRFGDVAAQAIEIERNVRASAW
jgi:hypothetical protein